MDFKHIEPLKENRWVIKTYPHKINPFLFRKYKMYNEGEKIIFKTSFFESVHDLYNPADIMEITDITLEYLDPVGEVMNGFKMIVSGMNFEKKHSYKNDGLLTTDLRFVIDFIQPLYAIETEENNGNEEQ